MSEAGGEREVAESLRVFLEGLESWQSIEDFRADPQGTLQRNAIVGVPDEVVRHLATLSPEELRAVSGVARQLGVASFPF